jgi:hypothetical protein
MIATPRAAWAPRPIEDLIGEDEPTLRTEMARLLAQSILDPNEAREDAPAAQDPESGVVLARRSASSIHEESGGDASIANANANADANADAEVGVDVFAVPSSGRRAGWIVPMIVALLVAGLAAATVVQTVRIHEYAIFARALMMHAPLAKAAEARLAYAPSVAERAPDPPPPPRVRHAYRAPVRVPRNSPIIRVAPW